MIASESAEIRTLLESWAAAVRARDIDAIVAHHSDDIVMFDLPKPLQLKGIDAYRKSWELFYSWSLDPVVFDFTDMDIAAGADVAFVAALMKCSGTEKNGERIELHFRLTVGLRKLDGHWTVTHEHHSIPSD